MWPTATGEALTLLELTEEQRQAQPDTGTRIADSPAKAGRVLSVIASGGQPVVLSLAGPREGPAHRLTGSGFMTAGARLLAVWVSHVLRLGRSLALPDHGFEDTLLFALCQGVDRSAIEGVELLGLDEVQAGGD